jgi:hypothetical protein
MDSITQLFGSGGSGGWLSNLIQSPGLKLGLAGSGAVGNILANNSRNNVLGQQTGYTKYLQNLTPTQISDMISQYQKPLSNSLINNVSNTTQAQLASRGLSQAPGIFASSLAQGIAPYELQEQQLAQQALFQKLGLPIQSRPSPFGPFPQTTNSSQLMQSLMQQFMKGGQNPGNIPNFNPSTNYNTTTGPQDFPVNSQGGGLPTGLPPDLINMFMGGGGLTPGSAGSGLDTSG